MIDMSSPVPVARFVLGYGYLVVSSGSVVGFAGDAIVNAANRGCLGGGGVDGAISRAGGRVLSEAREALPLKASGVRCPVGEAVITVGGNLKAKKCIHAVGPSYGSRGSESWAEPDKLLTAAYSNALLLASQNEVRTIAFSLLSAGVYRGDRGLDGVLSIAVESVVKSAYEGLQEVHLVCFLAEELEEVLKKCRSMGLEESDA